MNLKIYDLAFVSSNTINYALKTYEVMTYALKIKTDLLSIEKNITQTFGNINMKKSN